MSIACLWCLSAHVKDHKTALKPLGTYWFCGDCDYVFRDPAERPSAAEEKARYDFHQNEETPGYRAFYGELLATLRELDIRGRGLDFGCGPTAFLSRLLAERGYADVANYDPFFRDDPAVLSGPYDFITCTEVFEHLRDPRAVFLQLNGLLKPGGWLLVMTSAPPEDPSVFDAWSYRRDLTHIGFFRRSTFETQVTKDLTLVHSKSPLWVFHKTGSIA